MIWTNEDGSGTSLRYFAGTATRDIDRVSRAEALASILFDEGVVAWLRVAVDATELRYFAGNEVRLLDLVSGNREILTLLQNEELVAWLRADGSSVPEERAVALPAWPRSCLRSRQEKWIRRRRLQRVLFCWCLLR